MINKLLGLLLLIFISNCNIVQSQNYIPIDTTKHEIKNLFINEIKTHNEQYINEIKQKYHGDVSKYIVKNYTNFTKEFNTFIKKGNFIFEKEILNYTQNILDEIINSNPELKKYKFKLLISKSHTLNAYCLMDGTFVIHLGSFYWLENEDQIASVLSHEIAHKILEHLLKNKIKEFGNSKIINAQIELVKKEKYNISDKAFNLYKSNLYDSSEKSKKHEFEADSLGYLVYKNTNYSKSEYISALTLMQVYDTLTVKSLPQNIYKKYFDLPTQPFNEKWLLKEDFSSYNYSQLIEKINKDSIATHPETIERINKIKLLFPEVNSKINPLNPNKELYDKISKIAYLETIPNLYFDERYGYSIYTCLLLLESDENNSAYFKEWLGKSFLKIYEARKNYTLNRYLDRLAPNEQSESYQQFISFMWNLKLDEIKKIADFYNSKN